MVLLKGTVYIKVAGVFALLVIGATMYAVGKHYNDDGTTTAGSTLLAVGILIVIGFFVLSWKFKKNFFTD